MRAASDHDASTEAVDDAKAKQAGGNETATTSGYRLDAAQDEAAEEAGRIVWRTDYIAKEGPGEGVSGAHDNQWTLVNSPLQCSDDPEGSADAASHEADDGSRSELDDLQDFSEGEKQQLSDHEPDAPEDYQLV